MVASGLPWGKPSCWVKKSTEPSCWWKKHLLELLDMRSKIWDDQVELFVGNAHLFSGSIREMEWDILVKC